MPALLPLIPIIQIDSGEAQDLDVGIALQKIYYQPVGYQRNAKKLLEASIKTGSISSYGNKKKQVISQSSKTREEPMGYDEPRLTYDVLIRYLLEPGELEGDNNEGNSSERSFVHEELLIIPHDTELPPQWVLTS
ncbi:hypothetical protein GLOIN_2v1878227 [Rhizophagus clarus]|uniref:Uncharacterized protein n=1 Tax=Rhizophagus clarus TaxID=94130 RepID=A0A8H3LPS1_9GLOM|nr:hypothetical protein GLOIN_2v1878227 [Rhizophagus clarus]